MPAKHKNVIISKTDFFQEVCLQLVKFRFPQAKIYMRYVHKTQEGRGQQNWTFPFLPKGDLDN